MKRNEHKTLVNAQPQTAIWHLTQLWPSLPLRGTTPVVVNCIAHGRSLIQSPDAM